ncbi:nucleotidyltransferase family protein [Granulicella tundricola]|uniref:DNA polymerase beta domain protein region n=1 Tax=Granulicella tundricola (strain ATCC BAA-1859 / DSM 23138 / MP5ACTX9) TaxID=1198114 RepID=E8WVU9_GRATM|nr:nucleotidyltransferase domain-containing protein [Granulicella tundricola]ADW70708.1 DNA polymerase beta domain protein region [Granulicella tundricola MP5ACTX9]
MQTIITENQEQIAELCRQHHVRSLAVFGSAARDDFDPARSDVDLLVEFGPLSDLEYAPNYFSLLRSFDRLFGRRVDMLTDPSIRNPYLRKSIECDKVYLYAA